MKWAAEADRECCFDDTPGPTLAVVGFNIVSNDAEVVLSFAGNESEAAEVVAAEWNRADGFDCIKVVSIVTGKEVTLESYRRRGRK